MKHILIPLLLILLVSTLSAQNISVKSFKYLENDLTARTKPVIDQNGEKCALIKVVTPETDISWDVGMAGIVKVERKTGEYWLHVPWGVKAITIKHDKLGVLRNYRFPVPIKKASVYEMVLITAKLTPPVEEPIIENQWLVIDSDPQGATVYLNEKLQSSLTPFSTKVKTGEYTYRVELADYYNNAGKITVSADQKVRVDLTMQPAFGQIEVNSTPEQGALIVLDGRPTGKSTPATLEKVASGSHNLRLLKDMYNATEQQVMVKDVQTTKTTVDLKPNFSNVNISTEPVAAVYIDGEQKATGTWKGRLDAGVHSFEARKEKHKNDSKIVELIAGKEERIQLKPIPRTGSVDIMSSPIDAKIFIDGEAHGKTPNTVSNLLIGDYTIKLEKEGYGAISEIITIKENQIVSYRDTLVIGEMVTIVSDPLGASFYLDGEYKGKTPYNGILQYGKHSIFIDKFMHFKAILKEITISPNSENIFIVVLEIEDALKEINMLNKGY